MNNPKISVITVTLNNVDTIEETIQSVVNQSYKNIEYIIIDGGSTDGALDIIERYKKKISYFVSEPDKGIYNAMNKGAKVATGDYLYFINAGDTFINENILKEIVRELIDDIDLLYGKVKVVGENNIPHLKGWVSKSSLKFGMKISQQAMFVKRETFNKVNGLDERYKIAADFDLLCKILENGFSVKRINKVICNYDNSGVSSNLKKSYEDTSKVILMRYGRIYFIMYIIITRFKLLVAKLI